MLNLSAAIIAATKGFVADATTPTVFDVPQTIWPVDFVELVVAVPREVTNPAPDENGNVEQTDY